MEEKIYRVYEYYTMMRLAYWSLPVLLIAVLIWFILFGTYDYPKVSRMPVGGGIILVIFEIVLYLMKKRYQYISFGKEKIVIADKNIKISDIEHYYICLPLTDLCLLRLTTSHHKHLLYIGKEHKEEIQKIMMIYKKTMIKTKEDRWSYGHMIPMCLAVILIIFAMVIGSKIKLI